MRQVLITQEPTSVSWRWMTWWLTSRVRCRALADECHPAPPAQAVDRLGLRGADAGAVDGCVGAVGQGVAKVGRGHRGVDRADLLGEARRGVLRVGADHARGAERPGQQPGGQADRAEPGHQHGVGAVDGDPAQRFVRGAEAASHTGAVDVRQRVGQHQHVVCLGEQQLGVPAVALPAVGLAAAEVQLIR